jgi:hypothetical protein
LYIHLFPHNSNYDIRDKLVAFLALGLAVALASTIKAIYEGNGRVPCPDGIEVLYLLCSSENENVLGNTILTMGILFVITDVGQICGFFHFSQNYVFFLPSLSMEIVSTA